jgi:hypothetical protein
VARGQHRVEAALGLGVDDDARGDERKKGQAAHDEKRRSEARRGRAAQPLRRPLGGPVASDR